MINSMVLLSVTAPFFPLSEGEIDKDEFIEALNRLIKKIGFQDFLYLPNT